ncbi:MAG: peroxiredoxin family protein [Pyrinomonadaceae bacterium]
MNKLSRKIELVANISIIVVAVAIGAVIVQKYFFSTTAANQQARAQPAIGSKLNVSDVNFSGQPKTLILALQTGCHFCNESAPFYKRLIENAKGKNIKLVAVFPQSIEESTAHLNELGLTGMEVRRSSLDNIQVSGTPTLILTNDKGEVTNFWVGKLPPDKEMEVINKLNS